MVERNGKGIKPQRYGCVLCYCASRHSAASCRWWTWWRSGSRAGGPSPTSGWLVLSRPSPGGALEDAVSFPEVPVPVLFGRTELFAMRRGPNLAEYALKYIDNSFNRLKKHVVFIHEGRIKPLPPLGDLEKLESGEPPQERHWSNWAFRIGTKRCHRDAYPTN